jgi:hypothetical protein
MPKYANLVQFSDILQHKNIQQSYYIQNIDAVCVIAQDWTIDSKSIIIFYTVLNYKTKLTNSIHFMIFCTNTIHLFYKEPSKNSKKQEERANYIRSLYEPLTQYMFDADSNIFIYENIELQDIIDGARIIKIMKVPRYFGSYSINRSLSYLKSINNSNWKIRQHFAILHYALKNHFATNKATTTNKAGQVLFNRRFNMHISQYI